MGYRTTKSKIKVESNKTNSYTEFYYHFSRNILVVALPLLVISTIVLSSIHISATSSGSGTDNLTISISSACTLSSVVNTEHNTNTNVGTYTSDIGRTTITTLCNDGNGHSVYAVGYSNNEEGNNKLINSEYPQYSIYTGLATSGLASQWAMKLNNIPDDPSPTPPTIESDYNDTYGLVPSYWTKVASRASGTTDMGEGSSFTTTYAVYASSNQHAGTYVGQVKYALFHPYKNENMLTIEDAFALSGKNKINIAGVGEYYAMQDMSPNICNTAGITNEISQTQLVDIRDNKLYWVAKLEDGNCWMTSNLDLDIGGTNTAPLNSNNTDISTTASGSGIYTDDYTEKDGVWTWNPVSTTVTSNHVISGTSVPGWSDNNVTPYSAEGGDTYYYTSNTTGNDTRYNSLQDCKDASHTEDECKRYFAGNYYNWTAAIASNNSTDIGSTVGEIASNSICPKGWRLPNASQTDNVNNEFGRMLYKAGITAGLSNGNNFVGYTTDGFDKIRSNPYFFVRSGFINGSNFTNFSNQGYYWSSIGDANAKAYAFAFFNPSQGGVYLAYDYSRHFGWSVRCIAR